jgi:hypothetical protein
MHHTHPWFTKSKAHNSTRHTTTRRAHRCSLNVATNIGTRATVDVHRHSKDSAAKPCTRDFTLHPAASRASTIHCGGDHNKSTRTNSRNGDNAVAHVENHLQPPRGRGLHTNGPQNATSDPAHHTGQCTREYRDRYLSGYLNQYLTAYQMPGMHRYPFQHREARLQVRRPTTRGWCSAA